MQLEDWLLLGILATGIILSVRFHKLDLPGALTGGLLAGLIYLGAGFPGVAMMTAFFLLGTLATSHKQGIKERLKVAEKSKGRRNTIQVLCNAGIPALCGLLAWIFPANAYVFHLMLAAGFSSATADTLSSELGTVYGKKFYNIRTFRQDIRGKDGVISLEGTFFGFMGSLAIAIVSIIAWGWNWAPLWIVLAGTLGNLFDSYMGATWQRRSFLNNNEVNLLNTFLAAIVALLMVLVE